jgi:hypothetical protein
MVMRKFGMNALALGALVVASLAAGGGAGCSGTKPTELVPGVSSQVVVPHDLGAVRVTVQANGQVIFDQGYDVGANGVVQLPSTLGVVSGSASPSTVVKVIIRGYQQPCEQSPDCNDLGDGPIGNNGAQILRSSVQTFVDQRILFLPMPLSYSCWNNNGCADGQSCKGNQCVTSTVDSSTQLVDFDPTLLDGTGVCFDPAKCFSDAVTAQLVDLPSCTFGVPYVGTPPSGVNVRIWYQDFLWTPEGDAGGFANVLQNGGEVEILNLDPVEGFTLGGVQPDAGASDGGTSVPLSLFQLSGATTDGGPATGLCQLYQNATTPPPLPTLGPDGGPVGDSGTGEYVTISHVDVAPYLGLVGCAPKPPLLPICAGEQSNAAILPGDAGTTPDGVCNVGVTMTPTQSALYLAFDDSQVMNGAYGPTGAATALSVSLSNPVFKRTYAASTFFHQSTGSDTPSTADCTAASTSFLTPKIPFSLAASVQGELASQLLDWTAPDPGTTPCSPFGALDGGSTCPSGQVCAGTGSFAADGGLTYTCVTPDPLDLQAGLRLNAGVYGDISTFLQGRGAVNVGAAMFFVNRAPSVPGNDCSPLIGSPAVPAPTTALQAIEGQVADAFNSTPSLRTYFIVLDDDAHDTHDTNPPGALTFFNQVQSDLAAPCPDAGTSTLCGMPLAVTVLDATNTTTKSAAEQVGANFSKVVSQLGTCLYDYGLPSGYNANQVEVSYTLPGQTKTIIPQDANCNEANQATVSGWNFDNGRVRICGLGQGQACSTLQSGVLAAAAAAQNAHLAAPDVAVNATVLCASTGPVSDAGPVFSDASNDVNVAVADCQISCGGCCDPSGTCFVNGAIINGESACGIGGQLCTQCTGGATCSAAGACVGGTSTADASSDSGSFSGDGG